MKEYIPLFESILKILKTKGKSDDISRLLIITNIPAPSLLNDFFVEFSLTADPQEEIGSGCYSLEHLEKALNEVKETGTTNILNQSRV